MKAELLQIALENASDLQGAIALLEAALDALDRAHNRIPAAYVEHALILLRAEAMDCFEGLLEHQ